MRSSVVIITYQTEPGEVDAYAGLAAQRTPPDEVVVLDNGGPCAAPAPPAGARQLPSPGRNLGFAIGCNRAAAATQGDWIVFLNPDARPAPDWIEALHRAQRALPGVAAIGSLQRMDDADGRLDGVGDAYHVSGLCWRQGYGKVLAPDRIVRAASRAFAACAAAAAYRRDAFMALGGFDEDFFCYCEDVDLSFRMRLRGLDVAIACDAVVTHRGSVSSGGRRSDFALYHGHRNMVWVFVKNVPGWLFWALLPLHLMANLATIVRFTVQGRGGVILRAKRDAIRGLPRMWAKRRQIQRERTVSAWSILRRMRWSLVR
jgi:GT2 family glycosyltransferase